MSQDVPDDLITAPIAAAFFDRSFLWHYRARVERVIDGDTFVALVDLGFRAAAMPHIRIHDVYAPELHTPEGPLAMMKLARAFADAELWWDWPLRIISLQRETVVAEVTSFERWVADVFVVQHDGALTNVTEVLNG